MTSPYVIIPLTLALGAMTFTSLYYGLPFLCRLTETIINIKVTLAAKILFWLFLIASVQRLIWGMFTVNKFFNQTGYEIFTLSVSTVAALAVCIACVLRLFINRIDSNY